MRASEMGYRITFPIIEFSEFRNKNLWEQDFTKFKVGSTISVLTMLIIGGIKPIKWIRLQIQDTLRYSTRI